MTFEIANGEGRIQDTKSETTESLKLFPNFGR